MAIFKCKMCGGTLELEAGASLAVCEYCGTKQTLSKTKDEVIANLFNRANNLRLKCEFDKAEQVYESILQRDETDAEAHWGMVLCKYGIEYVDDPGTGKKIPTCHRTLFEAVTADVDYQAAVDYADVVQQSIYEAEARAIDRIQKGILEIVKNEKPFDVFICYKESDAEGKRTVDSVIANDIYHQLTQEGLKVFYAAITLEDKLGQEYEPYIFAALNSAKAMLVLGTKPEYFTAVWVKNEWSRFMKLMKTDRSRLLIPCFRDMDAYDLPEDFAHLQAQDMSKIGFISDVVRGIKKVVGTTAPKAAPAQTVVMQGSGGGNVQALLDRGYMALEDCEWAKADSFFEEVLNQDAKSAAAYLGKLMAELRVRRQEDLHNYAEPFDGLNNYQKALRFANPELKREFEGYNTYIREHNEETRLHEAYAIAVASMESAETESAYKIAAERFQNISGYKDANARAKRCLENAEITRKDAIYNLAIQCATVDLEVNQNMAIGHFKSISGWKDADEREEQCRVRLEELKLEQERRAEQKRMAKEKAAKKRKKVISIVAPIAIVAVIAVIVVTQLVIPFIQYKSAEELFEAGKYDEAIAAFGSLGNYKDSATRVVNYYKPNFEDVEAGDYVYFGTYEQDNIMENGAENIEWLVLERDGDRLFLLSKYSLDRQPYNTKETNITWQYCTLRSWLNDDFYSKAFTTAEQILIEKTTTNSTGFTTNDKVFLLGVLDAEEFFSSNEERVCVETAYAGDDDVYNSCWWWLRSQGRGSANACMVEDDGYISHYGPVKQGYAVRPAIWINLED